MYKIRLEHPNASTQDCLVPAPAGFLYHFCKIIWANCWFLFDLNPRIQAFSWVPNWPVHQCHGTGCFLWASILHRLGTLSKNAKNLSIPNQCSMLAFTYMQAFYIDWAHFLLKWHFWWLWPFFAVILHKLST